MTKLDDVLTAILPSKVEHIPHVEYNAEVDKVQAWFGKSRNHEAMTLSLTPDQARYLAMLLVEYAEKGNNEEIPRYNSAVIVLNRIADILTDGRILQRNDYMQRGMLFDKPIRWKKSG